MKGSAGGSSPGFVTWLVVSLAIAVPMAPPSVAQGDSAHESTTEEVPEAAESEIRSVLDAWDRALSDSDVEGLGRLLDEDVVFLPDGQSSLEGKTPILDSYRALFVQYRTSRELTVDEIRIGGDWAIVRGSERFRLEPVGAGEALETAPRRLLTILHRDEEGVWRFARAMTNRDTPRR